MSVFYPFPPPALSMHWPSLLGMDIWRNQMIIYRAGCLEVLRLELQPVYKMLRFPPSSTTAEHNCGFCTTQEKTTCKQKPPRKAELNEAVMGFKTITWVAHEERGAPALHSLIRSPGTISTIVTAGRKACQLVNRHFLGNFLDVGGGKSCHVLQLLLHSWHTLCFLLNVAAVGSKPSVDPGIHSTPFPETNLLN